MENFKKSDLREGMRVVFRGNRDDICIVVIINHMPYGIFSWGHARPIFEMAPGNNSPCDVIKVFGAPPTHDKILSGLLLWEYKEEITLTLDGIDYSKTTLRSLIKKATQ